MRVQLAQQAKTILGQSDVVMMGSENHSCSWRMRHEHECCVYPKILMPTKKPRGQELTRAQQRANQALHARRLRIEHVNRSVKRCRMVKDRIRLWKEGVRDVVMEICCALHNFRVRLSPWHPMVEAG